MYLCDNFVNGLSCSGYPNSELCKHCPSMEAGYWRTPAMCKAYRKSIERKVASKQPVVKSAFDSQEGGNHYKVLGIQH